MNELRHTAEDAMSLPSTRVEESPVEGPQTAPTAANPHLEALEYYRSLHARHTFWARVALLTAIVGMLGANMWLSQRNYTALLVNVDQVRLAQADMIDQTGELVQAQQVQIAALQARIATLESETLAVADAH